jgi:hypothetical protein
VGNAEASEEEVYLGKDIRLPPGISKPESLKFFSLISVVIFGNFQRLAND